MAKRDRLSLGMQQRRKPSTKNPTVDSIMSMIAGDGVDFQTGLATDYAIIRTDEGWSIAGCSLTPAGLDIPDNVAPETLDRLEAALFAFDDGIQLWIGDLLAVKTRQGYGDVAAIAAKYDRAPETLYKWTSICRSVKTFLRRKVLAQNPENRPLRITHYEQVMSLSEEEQEYWLMRAAANNWSAAHLGAEIRGQVREAAGTVVDKFQKRMTGILRLVQGAAPQEKRQVAHILREIADRLDGTS